MELNINSIINAISKEVKKTYWKHIHNNDDYEFLDMLIYAREDMLDEQEAYGAMEKTRIYNQYQNESCRRLFEYNKELRLFDFSEFLSKNSCTYFTVGSCRDIKSITDNEIDNLLIKDMDDIIRYIMRNPSKNEITKKLYNELIVENL